MMNYEEMKKVACKYRMRGVKHDLKRSFIKLGWINSIICGKGLQRSSEIFVDKRKCFWVKKVNRILSARNVQ